MALPAPPPVSSTARDLLWLDTNGLPAEDATPIDSAALRSPSPSAMLAWLAHASSTVSVPLTGQLSPVSPGMDVGDPDNASTSASTATASSSFTDSWALDCLVKRDGPDTSWAPQQQDGPDAPVPKVEAVDDDEFDMTLLKPVAMSEAQPDATPAPVAAPQKVKRPRGRPRKHPVHPVVNANKAAKGRSKTGCITCRKRKKKCDEAKPRCLNCEKNAVVCEGYHEKQIWKSGKEKAEEARLRRESLPSITLQPIFHGVETPEDTIFWKHYCNHLSNVLTVEGEHRNAFKDMVLQLATRHKGLMHSILSLSSRHIDRATPHGAKLIREASSSSSPSSSAPEVTEDSLQRRAEFHHEESMRCLYEDMARAGAGEADGTTLSARYGQMLCLLLQTQVEGNPRGEHRVHLQAYRNLINHSPPEDPAFLGFITEFFEYYIFADELMAHPGDPGSPGSSGKGVASAEWTPAAVSMSHPPRLIGVADGLFAYMSRITRIRNAVRSNILSGAEPVVDYASLYHAAEIDAGIREWMPRWPPGDGRDRVSLLYKQTMWVYLFRTIYPPSNATRLPVFAEQHPSVTVDDIQVPPSPVSSINHAVDAQHSPSSHSQFDGCHHSGYRRPSHDSHFSGSSPQFDGSEHTHRRPSHDSRFSGTSPPPPLPQQHPHQDPRVTKAIHESLSILESFKPSDPCQTLLLMPCMVLGTACFEPAEQERVRLAVRRVRGYTGLRKCDLAMEVLEEVWRLAADGEWMCVWDWQGVARRLGLDFLCA